MTEMSDDDRKTEIDETEIEDVEIEDVEIDVDEVEAAHAEVDDDEVGVEELDELQVHDADETSSAVEEIDDIDGDGEPEVDLAHEGGPLGDLDDVALEELAPEVAVAESLRNALNEMRSESDRIASLDTGDEQVQAAERFAEAAGSLDEQIGSSARADDDARS